MHAYMHTCIHTYIFVLIISQLAGTAEPLLSCSARTTRLRFVCFFNKKSENLKQIAHFFSFFSKIVSAV